ncbi:MAG TPA: hypothetical protein VLU96_11245 [Gaiellaceae bacterium]|nr:hypothetical protein [Gaiellaceae bacterium]
MGAGFVLSYAVLCLVQAALAGAPVHRNRQGRFSGGALLPAIALGLGVGLLRLFAAGPISLALLATIGAPVLAASLGWVLGWRRSWPMLATVAALYLIAWQVHSPVGQAAGMAIIGLACLAIAAAFAAITPRRAIQTGLVLLALVDVILVWGTPQVGPAAVSLDRASLPALSLPFLAPHPLPALQDATFGSALMGWLDLLAPALLATTLVLGQRTRAAIAVGVAAGAWGLLFVVTPVLPATVPIVVAMVVLISPAADRPEHLASTRPVHLARPRI